MNKSINFCHYPHSMCNPALYCNAAYLVIYETTVDHINNDDIHVSTTDRSKLDSIEAILEKLNNIDLSKYVTNDDVSSIVQDYVGTLNYLTEVPSYYTTDEELSNTMTGLATIDNVASILNNKYYTRSQIDELLRNRRNTDIHITDVDFDGSQLIITESDGSVYKTAVSFSGGYSSVTITIYKRSENKPEVPTGGDYDFDNNQFIATDLTEGWYANKSDEDDSLPLWMSLRIFLGKKKITEEDEDVPLNGEWSEPVKLSGNNSTSIIEKPVSASHVEVVYHKAIYNTSVTGQVQSTAPNTPIGGSYDFTTKEFTVPHNPVDETDLWSTTVSNDSYTITNSDGTTLTIYYTWYFSIGSIGEGESDFTWTTPAVYGVDYTQVAYNMRFIAVDYSVLAQNVKFTTGDFLIIAGNITLNSEQLTAIAKDVTIKSELDLKLIANNLSIDTTGVANAIDKAEIVDKLMLQEGYSKELAEKIAENGTMQVKTGLFLMDSNVFVGNVSDELLIRVGDDVDMSVTDKLNEILLDINQHKQDLIDSVNNATSDENITNKVTSVVATDDYIAAVANNVVLDTNDLKLVSYHVDIKTLDLNVLAKRVLLTTEFAGLVAKEIDIDSALTTFHGDIVITANENGTGGSLVAKNKDGETTVSIDGTTGLLYAKEAHVEGLLITSETIYTKGNLISRKYGEAPTSVYYNVIDLDNPGTYFYANLTNELSSVLLDNPGTYRNRKVIIFFGFTTTLMLSDNIDNNGSYVAQSSRKKLFSCYDQTYNQGVKFEQINGTIMSYLELLSMEDLLGNYSWYITNSRGQLFGYSGDNVYELKADGAYKYNSN